MDKVLLDKKNKVDKYLRKKKYICLFDVLINDLENVNLYIRLDYVKTSDIYKVTWVNLTQLNVKKIENWINSNLIYPSNVNQFKSIIAKNGISQDFEDDDNIESSVTINSYLRDYENNKKTFIFNRYIPKCWSFLADALFILFETLPKYLYIAFQILTEKLNEPRVNSVFVYDPKKDNLDDLFNEDIRSIGKDIYDKNRVTFIEKAKDVTYSIVSTNLNYLVSIYDLQKSKEMQLSCTCESAHFCEHMYAALLALKDNKELKFFKISRIDSDESIIDNLNNFNYYYCAGIFEDTFVIINHDNFEFVPILENDKLNFKIIEDDNKKTLEKQLKEYLNKKK